jgi:LysM domain
MNNQQTPITLTPRGRLVLGLVVAFFALLAWITIGGGTADASADQALPISHTVVVQPGESLWSIATDIAPEHDPREVLMRIREMNDLGTQHVYPGQSLAVPTL